MVRNLGAFDRILRLAAGIAFAVIAWFWGGSWPVFGPVLWVVAAVALLSPAFATCPAHPIFGFSTCALQKK